MNIYLKYKHLFTSLILSLFIFLFLIITFNKINVSANYGLSSFFSNNKKYLKFILISFIMPINYDFLSLFIFTYVYIFVITTCYSIIIGYDSFKDLYNLNLTIIKKARVNNLAKNFFSLMLIDTTSILTYILIYLKYYYYCLTTLLTLVICLSIIFILSIILFSIGYKKAFSEFV